MASARKQKWLNIYICMHLFIYKSTTLSLDGVLYSVLGGWEGKIK